MMEQADAILIRSTRWSDTSLITTWLTASQGKVRLVARSARKPGSAFAGKIDLFYRAEIGFAPPKGSGGMGNLREVKLTKPFDAARMPCANVFLGGYFAELVDLCTEHHEPVPDVFFLLARAVEYLGVQPANARALDHFENELCRVLGIHGGDRPAIASLESYAHRIPASRAAALRMLG